MIEISLKTGVDGTYELSVKGHADYGEKGKDPVCAAVSALLYTACKAVSDSREMLLRDPITRLLEGDGYLFTKVKPKYEGNIQRSIWTIMEGFELLSQAYPESVKIV